MFEQLLQHERRTAPMPRPTLWQLGFAADTERQYLRDLTHQSRSTVRFTLLFATLIYSSYLGMDYWLFERMHLAWVYALVPGLAAPVALLGIWSTYAPPEQHRLTRLAVMLAVELNGLLLAAACVIGQFNNVPVPYESLLVYLVYIYFLLGIPHRSAVLLSLLIALIYSIGVWQAGMAAPMLYDRVFSITAMLLVGALVSRILELSNRQRWLGEQQLRQMAERDRLTGLFNQRTFYDRAEALLGKARIQNQPVALFMLELEHLPSYNPLLGHPAMDDCLRRVATCLRTEAEYRGGLLGRMGGELFALLLPHCDAAAAAATCTLLRQSVAALRIPHPGASSGLAALRIGVVAKPAVDFANARAAAKLSDEALFKQRLDGSARTFG